MNARNIEAVAFWTPEGEKIATKILLYNFHGYNFDGSDSAVSYKLLSDTDESLLENSVTVPDSVVQNWGSDDDPMFTYVIETLNLREIE